MHGIVKDIVLAHLKIRQINVTRLIPAVVFIAIFVAHALYVSACRLSPLPAGRTSVLAPISPGRWAWGLTGATGLFHRFFLCVGCGVRDMGALSRSILFRQERTVTAGAAAGGVTRLGALMAGGCFLIGCCGSPMLASRLLEPVRRQSLGLRQTLNGLGDSDFRQLLCLKFP
jgi:hypothetical protein